MSPVFHARCTTGVFLAAMALAIASTMLPARAEPAVYAVTRVDDNDVLNVRESADHTAPIVSTLAHDAQSIQLTGQSQNIGDAVWVEIALADKTGWVNKHYLKEMGTPQAPDTSSPATDDRFSSPLTCSGTEPFWALDVNAMRGTLDALSEGRIDLEFETVRPAQGVPVVWSFRGRDIRTGNPAFALLEETRQCSDGMSDLAYKYSIRLDIENGPFFAGCCNRMPGQPDP